MVKFIKLYEEIQGSSTVTFVPEKDFPLKTKASLEANGSSKDNSNPLIPVALGKSKMTICQILTFDYRKQEIYFFNHLHTEEMLSRKQ